ncbi:MAG: hypothetical protein QOH42_287, partial [Blastocatellia bacterium]|nr:hypothetical protein [Blastocatellia bacterium]
MKKVGQDLSNQHGYQRCEVKSISRAKRRLFLDPPQPFEPVTSKKSGSALDRTRHEMDCRAEIADDGRREQMLIPVQPQNSLASSDGYDQQIGIRLTDRIENSRMAHGFYGAEARRKHARATKGTGTLVEALAYALTDFSGCSEEEGAELVAWVSHEGSSKIRAADAIGNGYTEHACKP